MDIKILSGLPGSGKSHYAAEFEGAVICSADTYTFRDGKKFNPADLPEGHRRSLELFVASRGAKVLIVDNTNLTAAEIAPYYAIAEMWGEAPRIIRVNCDPEKAYLRQKHGVPFNAYCGMVARWRARDVMPWWNVVELK